MSNQFNYKYSAPTEEERKEIDSIRRQYVPSENKETKLERLRRLDSLVKSAPSVWGLVLGIVGILIFGLGLAMILEWDILVWGIVLAVIGCVPIALAYPVYNAVLQRNKKRYGEEIIRLSDELLNENEK